jgi:hypothetical protein
MDLLVLFHVMNEGMVNILQHFFEMSKPDAQRTLVIYRTFVKQTDNVVKYLSVARNYEHVTRLEIPTLKHAPTVLTNQLEDYVNENDFEVMRQQYIAQQVVKKSSGSKSTNGSNKLFEEQKAAVEKSKNEPFPEPKTAAKPAKGPAPDMVDFFESIEQNQTQMNTNPFQQQTFGQQNVPQQATGFDPQPGLGGQQTGFPGQQTGFQGQQAGFQGQQTGFQGQQTGFQGQQNSFMPQPTGIPQQQAFGQQPTGMPNQQSPFSVQTTGLPGQQQAFSPTQSQPTGNPFAPQQNFAQNNTPQPLQPNFTGAGFGGYTPAAPQPQQNNRFTPGLSSIPQNSASSFQPQSQPQQAFSPVSPLEQQNTNPFRQSVLPPQATGAPTSFSGAPSPFGNIQTGHTVSPIQHTNPFGMPQNAPTPPTSNSPFGQPAAQQLMPAATGTNPFARTAGSPAGGLSSGGGVSTNVTGSTNPFRQSHFVNQSKSFSVSVIYARRTNASFVDTGLGWQSSTTQGTIGGLSPDQIQTNSIFPRPGGAPPMPNQQQQNTGWPS